MTRRMIRKRLVRTGKVLRPWMLGLAKFSLRNWPIAAAAVGGMLVHRMWSNRRLQRAVMQPSAPLEPPPVQASEVAESVEAWTPTAPNLSAPPF